MVNWLKEFMLVILLMQVIQLKKLTITQKFLKLKKNIDRNHDQYITAQEYDKLTSDNFKSRLTESKLAIKMILLIS